MEHSKCDDNYGKKNISSIDCFIAEGKASDGSNTTMQTAITEASRKKCAEALVGWRRKR